MFGTKDIWNPPKATLGVRDIYVDSPILDEKAL